MSRDVNINKQVFDKSKFNQTVDTSFSQLIIKPEQLFFDTSIATIDDFFTIYERLFYQIPKDGETNSHQYLIHQSTEYAGFDKLNEEIQALLAEIAGLREDLLRANKSLAEGSMEPISSTSTEENGTNTSGGGSNGGSGY